MPSRMRPRPKTNSSSGSSAASNTPASMNAVSAGYRPGSASCLSMRGYEADPGRVLVESFAVRGASLDDVFLTLTRHDHAKETAHV
jgi:hypothetical protein